MPTFIDLARDGAAVTGLLYTATVATAALTALTARTPRRRRDARAVLALLLRRRATDDTPNRVVR